MRFLSDSYVYHSEESLNRSIKNHLLAEEYKLNEYIFISLLKNKSLGNYLTSDLNKLRVLSIAKRNKLNIPNTAITNHGDYINKLNDSLESSVVTKFISEIYNNIEANTTHFFSFTELIKTRSVIGRDFIFPGLFQQKIEKLCDIRSFLLNGNFFSMALFPINSDKHKIDFRENYDIGLRMIPFALPKQICRMLLNTFTDLNLDTGSIDLILDKTGKYFFIEINPVGDFSMVSNNCNYYIEKHIAKYLHEM